MLVCLGVISTMSKDIEQKDFSCQKRPAFLLFNFSGQMRRQNGEESLSSSRVCSSLRSARLFHQDHLVGISHLTSEDTEGGFVDLHKTPQLVNGLHRRQSSLFFPPQHSVSMPTW